MKAHSTKFLCVNAVLAALYVVLTMPFGVLTTASGFQFRPAEALTILPVLFPYTVWGLAIGCAISNLVSAFGVADVVLGALTTLVAGFLTARCRKFYLAPLPPVLLNAFLLPLIWMIASPVSYWPNVLSLLLTQSAVIFGLGIPLYFLAKKTMMPLLSLDNKSSKGNAGRSESAESDPQKTDRTDAATAEDEPTEKP